MSDTATQGHDEVQQLRQELAISQAISENSPINILRCNTDLIIEYVNPASCKNAQDS